MEGELRLMESLLVGAPFEAVVSDRTDLSTFLWSDASMPVGCLTSFIAFWSNSEESIPFTLLRRLSKGDGLLL